MRAATNGAAASRLPWRYRTSLAGATSPVTSATSNRHGRIVDTRHQRVARKLRASGAGIPAVLARRRVAPGDAARASRVFEDAAVRRPDDRTPRQPLIASAGSKADLDESASRGQQPLVGQRSVGETMGLWQLRPGALVRGLVSGVVVRIVQIEFVGAQAVKPANRAVWNPMHSWTDEVPPEPVRAGRDLVVRRRWLFRLASKLRRIHLAHLFDPYLTPTTSTDRTPALACHRKSALIGRPACSKI